MDMFAYYGRCISYWLIDAFNFKVLQLTDSGSTFIVQSFNILHHLCAKKMISMDYIDIFWKHISTSSWSFSRSLGLFFNVVISFWSNQWLVTLHPCLANQVQHNHPLSHGTFAPWTASRGFCFSGHSKESTFIISQPCVFVFSWFHIGNSESL